MLKSALGAFLQIPGLIEDEDSADTQVVGDESAHLIAHGVLVPHGAGHKVLESIRAVMSYRPRQFPAVAGHTGHQQTAYISHCVRPQVMPREDRREQSGELRETRLDPSRHGGRAGRSLIRLRHTMMITERPACVYVACATYRANPGKPERSGGSA